MLHADTVTVLQVTNGPPDASGVASQTTKPVVLERCHVTPVGTEETIGETEPVTGRWRVSTHEPADWIRARDTVEWNGKPYPIKGRPQTYWGARPHTEFIIYETRG